jgi:probable rRNA maturation factor
MCPVLMPESLQSPDPEERVSVQVDDRFGGQVDAADLARTVLAVLQAEDRSDAEVTLVIGGDEEIAALNLQFLGEDRATDVLSFPASGPPPEGHEPVSQFVSAPEADAYLGDIIIAFPFAERQAAGLGRALADELRLLAVHGTLHLLGYDHAEPEEEAAMWARQDAILERLGQSRMTEAGTPEEGRD